MRDETSRTVALSLQGPASRAVLGAIAPGAAGQLQRGQCLQTTLDGTDVVIARAGYTGERGYDLFCPEKNAAALWGRLLEAGRPLGLGPAGMAARESLRIEACLPAYGHELAEDRSPIEAGLKVFVDFAKRFIGRGAVIAQSNSEHSPWLVAFEMAGDCLPRPGNEVEADDQPTGVVTSATWSPCLKKNVGMAYIAQYYSLSGRMVNIRVERRRHPAFIVDKPLFRRNQTSAAPARRLTVQ